MNNRGLFSHTWLLCVEMQFCLVVPLFFKWFDIQKHKKHVLMLGILSCVFQIFAPRVFAQEFMLLHTWQFMLGMMAFYWNNDNKQRLPAESEQNSKWIQKSAIEFGLFQKFDSILACVCLSLLSLTMVVNEHIGLARARCSLFAVCIIMAGTKQQSPLLTNPISVFLGNHAYSARLSIHSNDAETAFQTYLVHWPAIVYWKYLFSPDIKFLDGVEIAVISIFVAWMVDFLIDRVLMKVLNTKIQSIIFILGINICCQMLLSYLHMITYY